jgi:prepilin-type N-terminal cleavage/methylation domain-containing protein
MKKQQGFTLIEMLIAITLIGITVTMTTDIFARLLRVANKTTLQAEIKRNSEIISSQLERILRNAQEIKLVGTKTIDQTGSKWKWERYDFITNNWSDCDQGANVAACGIIVKNPSDAPQQFTKIVFHKEVKNNIQDTIFGSVDCPSSIFSAKDKLVNGTQYSCNGYVTIDSDDSADDLRTSVGASITNINLRSGVSIKNITIKNAKYPNRPSLFQFTYTITQGLNSGTRITETEQSTYTTLISLRNY